MPYLRMFLGEQEIDEIFISEVFLQSVLSNHILEEEKQKMLRNHASVIQNAATAPFFALDAVPSSINRFTPLSLKKDEDE